MYSREKQENIPLTCYSRVKEGSWQIYNVKSDLNKNELKSTFHPVMLKVLPALQTVIVLSHISGRFAKKWQDYKDKKITNS